MAGGSSVINGESSDTADRVALLRNVPIFAGLSEEDLAAVAAVSVTRNFSAGEVVFREGDGGDTCFIVRSGLARAVRQHSDGRSITLSHFAAGDIFGELAMFDEEPRSATVDVIDDAEVVAIPGRDMQRLMREYPEIAVKLNAALAQRLRATNERLSRQSFQTVQSRVAAVLSQMVASARGVNESESDVVITLTQADLAKLAGSSRESASRFLATLERSGVISQGRGRLTVHDPGALEGYVY
jgi:CRP/FNR family transcriptional regulator, cyclic AMP receptor protein